MPDHISAADRALIDDYVARNGVTQVPPGVSAFEMRYDPETGHIRYVDDRHALHGGRHKRGAPRQPLVALRRSKVRALCEQGATVPDMLSALRADGYPRLTESVVREDLAKLGLTPTSLIDYRIAVRREAVRALCAKGLSVVEIAAHPEVNVSADTVRGDLSALGLSTAPKARAERGRGGKRKGSVHSKTVATLDLVERRMKEGRSYADVSAETGLGKSSICNYVATLKAEGRLPTDFRERQKAWVNAARRKAVLKAVQEGRSATEIARDLGVDPRTIQPILTDLRREGVLSSPSSVRQERHAKVRALRAQGKSVREIADELGAAVGTICGDLRALGLPKLTAQSRRAA